MSMRLEAGRRINRQWIGPGDMKRLVEGWPRLDKRLRSSALRIFATTANTNNLPGIYRGLNNLPRYAGNNDFRKAMERYGIKEVLADSAAKTHLDNNKLANELFMKSGQPLDLKLKIYSLKRNLKEYDLSELDRSQLALLQFYLFKLDFMRVYWGTGVKMIIDENLHKAFFVRSKENLGIFSTIGSNLKELRLEFRGLHCPDVNQLARFVRGNTRSPFIEAKIRAHLRTSCPRCQGVKKYLEEVNY